MFNPYSHLAYLRTEIDCFNGPWGYRAQYWINPFTDLAANAAILDALKPKLLECVDINALPDLAKINVCTSLRCLSAKIWVAEADIFHVMTSPTVDLDVDRWREAAARKNELAEWGFWAPVAKSFEVKGALLDPYGNEVIPARKLVRHYDIHNYGFS